MNLKMPELRGTAVLGTVPTLAAWGRRVYASLAEPLRMRYPSVGVELTSTTVKAVCLKTTPEGKRILSWTRRDLDEDIWTVSMLDAKVAKPADMARHIERAVESVGGVGDEVSVLFPTLAARIAFLDLDELPAQPKEQLEVVRWKMKDKLPYSTQLARIMYETHPVADGKVRVLAVAVRESVVESVEEAFSAVGLHVGLLQPILFGSCAALGFAEGGTQASAPVLGVVAARRHLTMGVFEGGKIRMLRIKDASHLPGDEYRALCMREAAATARHFEEHEGKTVVECRFIADDPAGEVSAATLGDALSIPVREGRWPRGVEPENPLSDGDRHALTALAWTVAPQE